MHGHGRKLRRRRDGERLRLHRQRRGVQWWQVPVGDEQLRNDRDMPGLHGNGRDVRRRGDSWCLRLHAERDGHDVRESLRLDGRQLRQHGRVPEQLQRNQRGVHVRHDDVDLHVR